MWIILSSKSQAEEALIAIEDFIDDNPELNLKNPKEGVDYFCLDVKEFQGLKYAELSENIEETNDKQYSVEIAAEIFFKAIDENFISKPWNTISIKVSTGCQSEFFCGIYFLNFKGYETYLQV